MLEDAAGQLSQRELSDILVVDRSNVTGLIDRMEKAGWVKRQSVPEDRRAYRIRLTPAGRRLWHKVIPVYQAATREVVGVLSDTQVRTVSRALGTLETSATRFEAELPAK